MARGKPVTAVAVLVMAPGKKGETEDKTDEQGWTKAFDGAGRYGTTCRRVESKSGELNGKKYEGINQTATLVVDVK